MKTSKVFYIAKLGVSHDGRYVQKRYICHSITNAYTDGLITKRDEARTKKIISSLLNREGDYNGCLENWLRIVKNIHPTYSVEDRKKMQATRHAWLDSLIAEYAAKGD